MPDWWILTFTFALGAIYGFAFATMLFRDDDA